MADSLIGLPFDGYLDSGKALPADVSAVREAAREEDARLVSALSQETREGSQRDPR